MDSLEHARCRVAPTTRCLQTRCDWRHCVGRSVDAPFATYPHYDAFLVKFSSAGNALWAKSDRGLRDQGGAVCFSRRRRPHLCGGQFRRLNSTVMTTRRRTRLVVLGDGHWSGRDGGVWDLGDLHCEEGRVSWPTYFFARIAELRFDGDYGSCSNSTRPTL